MNRGFEGLTLIIIEFGNIINKICVIKYNWSMLCKVKVPILQGSMDKLENYDFEIREQFDN